MRMILLPVFEVASQSNHLRILCEALNTIVKMLLLATMLVQNFFVRCYGIQPKNPYPHNPPKALLTKPKVR